MIAARSTALFLLLATLVAGPGARARPAAAASPRARAVPDPATSFELFGWVSPPVESTTAGHVAEMAAARLTLALPAWADSGRREDNLARLDLAAANGIRCLVWDRRFERFVTLDVASPAGGALLDSIVADYAPHPGFYGYYLGDEPPESQFPFLAALFAALRARDPAHPAWNNLIGPASFPTLTAWRDHVTHYVEVVRPAVVSDDYYSFLTTGDRGQFFDNLAGLRAIADSHGLPFWVVVLMIQHGSYRALTEGELSWQVAMALAYGAHGVSYFTWWTPAPDPLWNWREGAIGYDGRPTHWFDTLVRLDPLVRAAGGALAPLAWRRTLHAGGAPEGATAFAPDSALAAVAGRAAIGEFADAAGVVHLLVANADSLAARTITLTLRAAHPVSRLEASGAWRSVVPAMTDAGPQLPLDLEAGGFALVRLDAFAGLAAGAGPALVVAPEPAHGEARFALARLGGAARLTIVDLSGRRVWTRDVAGDEATVVWRGERDRGGAAGAGLYLVRIDGATGRTTRRLHWLGAR